MAPSGCIAARGTFLHTDLDACWKVQRALNEQGIEYQVGQARIRQGLTPRGPQAERAEIAAGEIEFQDGKRLPRRVRRDGHARAGGLAV